MRKFLSRLRGEKKPLMSSVECLFDVRHMMAAMPGVQTQHPIQPHLAPLGMPKRAGKRGVIQASQQRRPTLVQAFQNLQRGGDWSRFRISQFCPFCFVIWLDRGIILRQGEPEPDVAIQVTVGQMVYYLPHGPTAGPVRRVKLWLCQMGNSMFQFLRQRRNRINPFRSLLR